MAGTTTGPLPLRAAALALAAACLAAVLAPPAARAQAVPVHPANDWGDLPGGYDLTGARRAVSRRPGGSV